MVSYYDTTIIIPVALLQENLSFHVHLYMGGSRGGAGGQAL